MQKTSALAITCALSLFVFQPAINPAFAGSKPGLQERAAEGKSHEMNGFERAADAVIRYHDIRLFGGQQRINILPIVFWYPNVGLNIGTHVIVRPPADRRRQYQIILQAQASDKGSHKHRLEFHAPNIAGSGFSLHVRGDWERDILARYYGIGNDSRRRSELIDKGNPDFIDEDYYVYNLKRPQAYFFLTHPLARGFDLWLGAGAEFVRPQIKQTPATSFLAGDRPFGYRGGSGARLSVRLVRDTRGSTVFPAARSSLSEFSYEPNWASVRGDADGAVPGRDVSFQRLTVSNAQFFPLLRRRMVLAVRGAFETIAGDAPFYEMGEFGASNLERAVGGSQSLRGYQTRRFHDKTKLVTLTELRYNVTNVRIYQQTFRFILTGYVDSGRVWRAPSDVSLTGFHTSFGFGVWLNWQNNKIVRFDVGRSPEGWTPYLQLNTSF